MAVWIKYLSTPVNFLALEQHHLKNRETGNWCYCCGKRMLHANFIDCDSVNTWFGLFLLLANLLQNIQYPDLIKLGYRMHNSISSFIISSFFALNLKNFNLMFEPKFYSIELFKTWLYSFSIEFIPVPWYS